MFVSPRQIRCLRNTRLSGLKAIAENRPLIVWVGVERPDIEAVRPDALHLRVRRFPGATSPCVVVGRPDNGELWRIVDLPAAQVDRLRTGRFGEPAGPAAAHIQACLNIEMTELANKALFLPRGVAVSLGWLARGDRRATAGTRGRSQEGGRRFPCDRGGGRWRARRPSCFKSLTRPAPRPTPARRRTRRSRPLRPIERLRLTDEVSHTLFDEYAAHRPSPRGDEETGWVLARAAGGRRRPGPGHACRPGPAARPARRTCGSTRPHRRWAAGWSASTTGG